jgi:hypothetical protein
MKKSKLETGLAGFGITPSPLSPSQTAIYKLAFPWWGRPGWQHRPPLPEQFACYAHLTLREPSIRSAEHNENPHSFDFHARPSSCIMIRWLKTLVTGFGNYWKSQKSDRSRYSDLDLGLRIHDEQTTRSFVRIPNNRRAEHIAILGKTGTRKSSLLRFLLKQDIAAGRGFACFDLHGDVTGFVLATVAAQERTAKKDLSERIDRGQWLVLNLHKGKLGEQAATLGSLFLTTIKNALFSRKKRELFTLYCDEIQNLVSFGSGLDTILSEARKFGVSVVSANQFLDQYTVEMRSTILAVGTHIFFQLSSPDAQQIATALDGGKSLAEVLKNLPRRHMVIKTSYERWCEGVVPTLTEPKIDFSDLYRRCRARWGRKRSEVEQEIAHWQAVVTRSSSDALHDWE